MPKFQIEVVNPSTNRAKFVRALRLVGNIGLRHAVSIADSCSNSQGLVLVAGIESSTAEHLAKVLRESGAEVVVSESAVMQPMMCSPDANKKYLWKWLVGVKEKT